MNNLKIGQRAAFTCENGKIITGKVVAIQQNCYLVLGDQDTCATYGDGLFRFRSYIREDRPNFNGGV